MVDTTKLRKMREDFAPVHKIVGEIADLIDALIQEAQMVDVQDLLHRICKLEQQDRPECPSCGEYPGHGAPQCDRCFEYLSEDRPEPAEDIIAAPSEQEAPAKEHNAYTCDCGVCSACNGRDLRQEPGGEETESDRLSVAYTAGAMSRDAEIDALKQEVERLEDLAEGRKVMFKYERRKREQAQQERDTLRNLSLSLGNEKEVVEKQRDGWMERHELVSAQKKIVEAERDQFATEAHRQGWDDCVEAIGRNPFMLPLDELIYPGPKEDEDDYDYAADDRAYDEARERKL